MMTNLINEANFDNKLAALAVEAKELRASVTEPKETDSVSTMHESLLETRRALDRLEAIVAELGRLRSRARRTVADAKDVFEDATIEAMQKTRVGEYSSADERRMTYRAASFDQFRALRQAEKQESMISEVYEYCYMRYNGLNATRRDLDTRIRLITLQTSLES